MVNDLVFRVGLAAVCVCAVVWYLVLVDRNRGRKG
jgi:hypothetical protein